MQLHFAMCLICHPPRSKASSVAYKDVTSVLKDKLVVKTRSSREVRSAQLHWPDSRIHLRCVFMSTVCMGMYTECHNSFAARRLMNE